MRILIASDIHGCSTAAEMLLNRFKEGGYDRMLFLGDLLYHGPRNALPWEYDCEKTSDILNEYKDKIMCVRGNCDSEVDQMMLEFPITATYMQIPVGDKILFASHGHVYGPHSTPPAGSYDYLLCGHTHIAGHWELEGGGVYCNPGSTSIPKGGSMPSYMTCEDGKLLWRYLETGAIYDELEL